MSYVVLGHLVIRASAGSGKTHQLTNRYLGLLAAGAEPDTILATTFTRKAAGEILDRVLERLAKAANDKVEARRLAEQIQAKKTTQADFISLLGCMLRNLHRVRIGTLDSFYIALAGSFSLELDLPASWTICQDADDGALQRDALERLLEQYPDDMGQIYALLSKGETKRSVQAEMLEVIRTHYESYRCSARSAWERLLVPEPVDLVERTAILEQLRIFDFSSCRHKKFFSTRDSDVCQFEQESWQEFLSSGLSGKIAQKETTFYGKQIPEEAQALYTMLIRHARSALLQRLAEQTKATWNLLDRFHREFWTLKQATGLLRFGEVTQVLVDALQRQTLRAETLAFRLDAAIEHLLLDEFQDTSLSQWHVLHPIAQGITQTTADRQQSFFCVGDVKQAIYGWRGGMGEIFGALHHYLGQIPESPLVESRRSAQPIIDVINEVFGNLGQFQAKDSCQDGIMAWCQRFQTHTTVKKEIPGYVCLRTGPAQGDNPSLSDQRGQHCAYVAAAISDLVQQALGRSIGVLCRKNDTIARMIYELRQRRVEASEEGGNPLTDSPAVELMLSLFTLADHPEHTIAWFHLQHSPLKVHIEGLEDADALSRFLRSDLLTNGYGPFTHSWAKRLAPACDRRDLGRLQQVVEIAYDYQRRSTLRADDFVAWVRQQRVPDPSAANVRVMTIHAAKGLEFDAVVLPELDSSLLGQTPTLIVGRDPASLDVNFVCRYADKTLQQWLTEKERRAFDEDRRRRVEESLSLLYVAMTRAIYALYLFIPGPRTRNANQGSAWHHLLRKTLAPESPDTEDALLYKHGNPNWFAHISASAAPARTPELEQPKPIVFRPTTTERRRGLEHVAPSHREGQARVALKHLFQPSEEGTGTAVGTLHHAWFATIQWLDSGVPEPSALHKVALKMRAILPVTIWNNLDKLIEDFLSYFQHPEVDAVLRRSAYASPEQAGFPTALARFWSKEFVPQQVETERRFLVRDGTTFWGGSMDRIVWLGDGDKTLAADVLDFKTDAIPPGDSAALAARTEHYRPQLEAYCLAVARLAHLPKERVAARLIFTSAGKIVDI